MLLQNELFSFFVEIFFKAVFFFFFLELNPTLLKNSIRISETNKNNLIGIRNKDSSQTINFSAPLCLIDAS